MHIEFSQITKDWLGFENWLNRQLRPISRFLSLRFANKLANKAKNNVFLFPQKNRPKFWWSMPFRGKKLSFYRIRLELDWVSIQRSTICHVRKFSVVQLGLKQAYPLPTPSRYKILCNSSKLVLNCTFSNMENWNKENKMIYSTMPFI